MKTGDLIKARRKALNMSAEALADKLNVSRSTIFRYENGDIEKLPTSVLEPLSKALLTTPAYLMGWESKPAPSEEESELLRMIRDARAGGNIAYILGSDGKNNKVLKVSDEEYEALKLILKTMRKDYK